MKLAGSPLSGSSGGIGDSVAARLSAWFAALPEGRVLAWAFRALLALAVAMVVTDLRQTIAADRGAPALSPLAQPSAPVRMDRPTPDDQLRPYLPAARPIAPDDGGDAQPGRVPAESEAAPMTFRLGTHGSAFADGTIVAGAADAFAEFLAANRAKGVTEIVLHSPGGSVRDAEAMGRLIRERKLDTRILPDGYCASSCPLVFAGGVRRVADRSAWIGVHQIYTDGSTLGSLADGMDQGQRVSAEAQALLHDLGVDLRVWTHAMATPKDQLYLFTPAELTELKLATALEGGVPAGPRKAGGS